MGRKPKLTEAQQAEARRRRAEGATLAELARSYGVGKSTDFEADHLTTTRLKKETLNPRYARMLRALRN
jgi:hypothetical protein